MPSTTFSSAAGGRLITQVNAPGVALLGTASPFYNPNTGGSPWTAIVNSLTQDYLIVGVWASGPSTAVSSTKYTLAGIEVSVGSGATGSEVSVGLAVVGQSAALLFPMATGTSNYVVGPTVGFASLVVPARVNAGARLSIQTNPYFYDNSPTTTTTFTVRIYGVPYTSLAGS